MTQVDPRRYQYREHPRTPAMKNWTVEEEALLLEMYAKRKSRKEIAARLNRSMNAVNGRISYLKAERDAPLSRPCGKCSYPCIKEDELTYCPECGWEPEESKGVVIIG